MNSRRTRGGSRQARMPITLKNPAEIAQMREAGRLVAETYDLFAPAIRPGVSLRELDKIAEDFLRSRCAQGLYKGYKGSQGRTRRSLV